MTITCHVSPSPLAPVIATLSLVAISACAGAKDALPAPTAPTEPVVASIAFDSLSAELLLGDTMPVRVVARDVRGARIDAPIEVRIVPAPPFAIVTLVDGESAVVGLATGRATLLAQSGALTVTQAVRVVTGEPALLRVEPMFSGATSGSVLPTAVRVTVLDRRHNRVDVANGLPISVRASDGAVLTGITTRPTRYGIAIFDSLTLAGETGRAYDLTYSAPGVSPAAQRIVLEPRRAATP